MPILSAFSNYSRPKISILQLEHILLGKEWNYSLCDNFNRVYFVMEGEGQIFVENETIPIRPNMIYIVPAMLPFRCQCEHSLEKVFVHFKCNVLPNRDILSNLDHVVQIPCTKEDMEDLKATLYEGGIYSTLKFRIQLEKIILDLVKPLEEAFAHDYLLYRKFESFFSYTNSHLYANLTIDEICANIGMTPRQLSYQYKAATGHSVKSYLNTLLLERIQYLLLTTDRSLQDISTELRFNNEFYCSRFFKKGAGVSPREYRKIHARHTKMNP